MKTSGKIDDEGIYLDVNENDVDSKRLMKLSYRKLKFRFENELLMKFELRVHEFARSSLLGLELMANDNQGC